MAPPTHTPPKAGEAPNGAEGQRLRQGGVANNLRLRATVLGDTRRFFGERDYLEVETPALVPSPGLDVHLDAYELAAEPGRRAAYLTTSPEYQMKRLLAGGLPRIFQICRCFRRGEQGARHNPEFTMLEWYRAHAELEDMMDETESLVAGLLTSHGDPARTPLIASPCDWTQPFARMTLAETFEQFADTDAAQMLDLASRDEERFFRLLIERVEPALGTLGVPVFIHHYPASQASLARLDPADPRFAERFELYLGDLELCNGFAELTDPLEQRERLERDQKAREELGKPVYPVDERFVAALQEGIPPCAGNALGLDRLVALCAGADSIDQVLAFPSAWL